MASIRFVRSPGRQTGRFALPIRATARMGTQTASLVALELALVRLGTIRLDFCEFTGVFAEFPVGVSSLLQPEMNSPWWHKLTAVRHNSIPQRKRADDRGFPGCGWNRNFFYDVTLCYLVFLRLIFSHGLTRISNPQIRRREQGRVYLSEAARISSRSSSPVYPRFFHLCLIPSPSVSRCQRTITATGDRIITFLYYTQEHFITFIGGGMKASPALAPTLSALCEPS